MDTIYDISKDIVGSTYEILPRHVVDVTKKLVMDSLAVSLDGSTRDGVKELRDIFKTWGERKHCVGLWR